MTPESFIAIWRANTRNEAAGSKPHFLDLCALLDVPPPHSDPTGATYAFEKGVKKALSMQLGQMNHGRSMGRPYAFRLYASPEAPSDLRSWTATRLLLSIPT
jgi:hypothetical protein